MNGHEAMRGMLPLAAAGVLTPGELATVQTHIDYCAECRRELDGLRLYSRALGELPQPIVPAGMLQRTRARLADERAAAAERRRHALTVGLMAMFSWAIAAVFWMLIRMATGGVWTLLGVNLVDPVTWSLVSALLVWTTAGVVVVTLGKRHETLRSAI